MLGAVRAQLRIPLRFERRAALARVPRGVDLGGDLERRVVPAERDAGRRDLVLPERRAVDLVGPRLVRRALPDQGLAADQRRPIGGRLRALERGVDRGRVVAVDLRDDLPAVRAEAVRRIVREPADHLAVDRDAVVVVDRDQLLEPERAGEGAGLVRDAFHETAVAHEDVGAVVDDLEARAVELLGEELLRERHPHRVRETLSERPGRRLDAGSDAVLGMARSLRVQLPEALQLLHGQVVAREVQQRVLEHRAVAVREHETVAVRPVRIPRVVAQVPAPEHLGDLGHPHRHAGMTGVGLLHRVHGERSHGVHHVAIGRLRDLLLGSSRHVVHVLTLRSATVAAGSRQSRSLPRGQPA